MDQRANRRRRTVSEDPEIYEAEAEAKKPFAVHDEDTADWVCKVIGEKAAELLLVKAQYESILTRIRAEIAEQESYLMPHLQQWASQSLEGQKRKSLILPHGTVQFRSVKAGLKVIDKDAAIAWAQSFYMDSAVNTVTTTTLDVNEYKRIAMQRLNGLGELLPGILTTDAHEEFSVRFGKEKEESNA